MSDPVSPGELAEKIRSISLSGPADLQASIEEYLKGSLSSLSPENRVLFVEQLTKQFEGPETRLKRAPELQSEAFSRLVSLLLGKKISISELSSAELSQKLAQSLNTVFDTLNEIVGVIHSTLLGQKAEQETIRQIIGSHIESEAGDNSLQNYLDQIREAFLVAHRAFRTAAETRVTQLLMELDPDKIAASTEGRLRFGALRKAELFDVYKEKYTAVKRWYDSGRLMEELLREFEKICEKLYMMEKARRKR